MADTGDEGIRWRDDVADHDFDAAQAYLSLRFGDARAARYVEALRAAEVTTRRANDILRASDRAPLPLDDPGVLNALRKAAGGGKLSPVLVVALDTSADIADGYHRVSLAYRLDPFADVPLRLAGIGDGDR